MNRIFKYELAITDSQTLDLPIGAELLSVANQRGSVCLWASVPQNAIQTCQVVIRIYGTGHPVRETNLKFLGTVLTDGGTLVWHVFQDMDQ